MPCISILDGFDGRIEENEKRGVIMKILAIDTSTQVLSVAILEDDQLIIETTKNTKETHGERLMPTIEWAFENSLFGIQEIDRIVIAHGPGSYTGLRIGVTTAKTLAWTLDKELVGLSSLQVIAGQAGPTTSIIVPLFDARRQNIYAGLYRCQKGQLQAVEADQHSSAQEFAHYLKKTYSEESFVLIGDDAASFLDIFVSELGDKVSLSRQKNQLASAYLLGKMASDKEAEPVHTFVPHYLKLTEAEENWLEAHPEQGEEEYVQKTSRLDG